MPGRMKHTFLVLAAATSLMAAAALAQAPGDPKPAPPGPTDPLTIVSGDKSYSFKVELADTPQETELGLMYRKEVPKDGGMIFDFGQPRPTTMWMKNTLVPLDMLFLGPDGTVLAIAQNARPHSERLIDPGVAVKGVLELAGGRTKELGIKPGDKVQHKMFAAAKTNGG